MQLSLPLSLSLSHTHKHSTYSGCISIALVLFTSVCVSPSLFGLCRLNPRRVPFTEPSRTGQDWPGVRVQLRKHKLKSASETVSVWLTCPDNERQTGPLCGWRQDTSRDGDAISHIQKQEWRKEWHSPSAKHKKHERPHSGAYCWKTSICVR